MNTLVTFCDCVDSCDDMDEMQKKNFFADLKLLTLGNCVCFEEMIGTQWQNDEDDIFISNNWLLEVYAKSCQGEFNNKSVCWNTVTDLESYSPTRSTTLKICDSQFNVNHFYSKVAKN